jgi:hypothetical protein
MAQLIPAMHKHNQWVYNLAMPVETAILSLGGYEYFKEEREKILIVAGYVVFLLVFVTELFLKGILVFSNHGFITEGIILLVLYLSVIYSLFASRQNTWKHAPEMWISLGIVIYFAGVIPYFSLMDYLEEYHPAINLIFYRYINIELSNVRYLLLAYGFWLARRNTLLKTKTANE